MIKFEKPNLQDITQMMTLVEPEVRNGNILPRGQDEMANAIRSYIVARHYDCIVGFCALYIYTPKLAEVRSLIVDSDYRHQGIGRKLVELLIEEGRELGICDFLVLTLSLIHI